MKQIFTLFISLVLYVGAQSQPVKVVVDISAGNKPISPFLYGRNNSLSNDPDKPLTSGEWQLLRDAGVKFLRESGGNNSTKYNWRRKLTSAPDWYNNVYNCDWDFEANSVQKNMPGAQVMWSFQLLGKTASSSAYNFNDWAYNGSQWWSGVRQNLAGGGVPNDAGGDKALVEGNPDLYLEDWLADSTIGIIDHWFGTNGLGLDSTKIRYWNIDNEPEIWSGTHDDVMPVQCTPDEFMNRYFDVAEKARAKFPGIKLVGPVTANEWQWYNWNNKPIVVGGKSYSWLEYFIKRIAEEQKATGIRLLDVLDIHYYPSSTSPAQVVQYHRVFFDKNYTYPEANGVKTINGGWDNSITKEYIFERCRDWLNKYLGTGDGVTFSVSETGIAPSDPNINAIWYASTLGEFMNRGVELFTPWSWNYGMWEVLHLYSRYNQSVSVQSVSSQEEFVSAYSSKNQSNDSLTVILVNRSIQNDKQVELHSVNFRINNWSQPMLSLSNLPNNETFVSHTVNALKTSMVSPINNIINVTLKPLSVSLLQLSGSYDTTITYKPDLPADFSISVYPNPVSGLSMISFTLNRSGRVRLDILDFTGYNVRTLCNSQLTAGKYSYELEGDKLSTGTYFARFEFRGNVQYRKLIILR